MTRSVNILGIDPGKTVGIAHLHGTEFHSWQLPRVDAEVHIQGIINQSKRIIVVCERFIIGANTVKKSRQADAIELGAVIRKMCTEHPHATYSLQMSSDAKRRVPHRHLQLFGWYVRGQDHANDAASHVGLALLRLHPAVMYSMQHPSIV